MAQGPSFSGSNDCKKYTAPTDTSLSLSLSLNLTQNNTISSYNSGLNPSLGDVDIPLPAHPTNRNTLDMSQLSRAYTAASDATTRTRSIICTISEFSSGSSPRSQDSSRFSFGSDDSEDSTEDQPQETSLAQRALSKARFYHLSLLHSCSSTRTTSASPSVHKLKHWKSFTRTTRTSPAQIEKQQVVYYPASPWGNSPRPRDDTWAKTRMTVLNWLKSWGKSRKEMEFEEKYATWNQLKQRKGGWY